MYGGMSGGNKSGGKVQGECPTLVDFSYIVVASGARAWRHLVLTGQPGLCVSFISVFL